MIPPAARGIVIGLLSSLLATGCVSFSKDGGIGPAKTAAEERLGKRAALITTDDQRRDVQRETEALLAQPLTPDDAMQIALLNNRGLQATYADLGIAEADLVQAGRLRNPRFTTTRTRADNGVNFKNETSLTFPIVELLTMPLAIKMEKRRFEAVKLQVAGDVLHLGLETRAAWYRAVAANETVRYYGQVLDAAEAGAELGRRMARAGNMNKRDQLREQAFYADAATQLARARVEAVASRERLTRLMGLWGAQAGYQLAERLPDLPKTPGDYADLEAIALRERLDVVAAKAEAEGIARSLGLTKATRFINVLELGPATVMEQETAIKKGYEISLEVPIFDWGTARVAKAEAQYMQAVNRIAQRAVEARSEVREAYATYRIAWDTSRHYRDEIVPVRKRISEENLLRYNGMLLSVFELLADAREQVMAVNGYIESLRNYWLAETELRAALGGRLPPTPTRTGALADQPATAAHAAPKE